MAIVRGQNIQLSVDVDEPAKINEMFYKVGESDKITTSLQVHILGEHKITDNLIQMIKSL